MTHKRTNKRRRGGNVFSDITRTASAYAQKAKSWLMGTPKPLTTYSTTAASYSPAPAPVAAAAVGGKRRRRFKTRRNKRGGSVTAYNKYNDPFTMNATPVSGYSTAKPHNWVGGRSRKRRH